MTKRNVVMVGGLLVVGLIASQAWRVAADNSTSRAENPADEPLAVQILRLRPVEHIDQRRTYTGTLRSGRRSALSFERSARLESVLVDEGDSVGANQVLARLDTRNLVAKRAQLIHSQAAERARLQELVAGPRKQTLAAAESALREAEADRMLRELNYRRSQRLLQTAAISQEEFDQASFAWQAASARRDTAHQNLDELRAGTRIERVDAQRYEVERLSAAIRDFDLEIEKSELKAPFAGVISRRSIDEGTVVSPATPVLWLVETQAMEAIIGLPPELVGGLKVGESYRLRTDKAAFHATLAAILPELNTATRTRPLVFKVDRSPSPAAVPGQVVRLDLRHRRDVRGFWVPTTALVRGARGLWSVYVVEQIDDRSVVVRRDVEWLHGDDDRSLIRGTVRSEDRVVVSGTHRIVAGQHVRVLEDVD